jgi:hypothetical protein
MRRAAILPAAFALALAIATPNLSAQSAPTAQRTGYITIRRGGKQTLDPNVRANLQSAVALTSGVSMGSTSCARFSKRATETEMAIRTTPVNARKPRLQVKSSEWEWTCYCPTSVGSAMELFPSPFDASNREISIEKESFRSEEYRESIASWMLATMSSDRPAPREPLRTPWGRLVDINTAISPSRQTPAAPAVAAPVVAANDRESAPDEVQVVSAGFSAEYGDILCGVICGHPNGHPESSITAAPPTEREHGLYAEPAPEPSPSKEILARPTIE